MNPRPSISIRPLLALMLVTLAVAAFGRGAPVSAQSEPASLTLNVYTCDAHNDPIDPNQTLINECNLGTEDIDFTLEQIPTQASGAGASTGTGGKPATISFSQLTPGDYRLTQETPKSIALSYVSQCTSNLRTFDYPFSPFAIIEPGGRLNIQLQPGEQLTCDWYNVQAGKEEAAALTITAYSCSGDVIGADICDLAPGVEFTITNPATMQEQHITTGQDGVATFDGSGDVQIAAVTELHDRNFCTFEPSDASTNGALTLDPANPTAIEAYYCYPGA